MKSIDLYHSTTLEGEIEALRNINADLLEACEYAVNYLPDGHRFAKEKLQQAINKAKGEIK